MFHLELTLDDTMILCFMKLISKKINKNIINVSYLRIFLKLINVVYRLFVWHFSNIFHCKIDLSLFISERMVMCFYVGNMDRDNKGKRKKILPRVYKWNQAKQMAVGPSSRLVAPAECRALQDNSQAVSLRAWAHWQNKGGPISSRDARTFRYYAQVYQVQCRHWVQ